ncbi:MAG: recombinase family protein [bacterium]|nr:recombinase family protein [bacterium]
MGRIVLYIRVSTLDQAKRETPKTQLEVLTNYCKSKGYNIIKTYIDTESGDEINRKELTNLRADAKKGLFDIIVMNDIGRLTRRLGHLLGLVEEFEQLGIKLEFAKENYEDNPEGNLFRNIKGAFYEWERHKITQRTKDGKLRKINEGKLVGTPPPLGHDSFRKTDDCGFDNCKEKGQYHFHINPLQAKNIELMFHTYLKEQSIRQTARILYKSGITGRHGKPLHIKAVAKMLRNEAYIGNYYYGKTTSCKAKYHYKENRKCRLTGKTNNPRSEWKLIKIKPIISEALFRQVQKILEERKIRCLKPTKYHYLCQGLIKCVRCNRTYNGKHKGLSLRLKRPTGDHFSYVCPQKFGRNLGEPNCHAKEISVRRLDSKVWEELVLMIGNSKKIIEAFSIVANKREKDRTFNQNVYNSLLTEKGNLRIKKSKILDLYTDGNFSKNKQMLDDKIEELNSMEESIDKQSEEAKKELEKIEDFKLVEEQIKAITSMFQEIIKNPTFENKKFTIRAWTKEIRIKDDGEVKLIAKVPDLEFMSQEKVYIQSLENMGCYQELIQK